VQFALVSYPPVKYVRFLRDKRRERETQSPSVGHCNVSISHQVQVAIILLLSAAHVAPEARVVAKTLPGSWVAIWTREEGKTGSSHGFIL